MWRITLICLTLLPEIVQAQEAVSNTLFEGISFEIPRGWGKQENPDYLVLENVRLPDAMLVISEHGLKNMDEMENKAMKGYQTIEGSLLSLVSEPDKVGTDYLSSWHEGIIEGKEALAFVIRRLAPTGDGGIVISAVTTDPNVTVESLMAFASSINKTLKFDTTIETVDNR